MNKSSKWLVLTEILSAAAVVTTLIFLLVEIRQNTEQTRLNARAVEISAYQDLVSQMLEVNKLNFEYPEYIILNNKQKAGESLPPDVLAEIEVRYSAMYWILFRHGDMAFHQFENGIIDEERLKSAFGILSLGDEEIWKAWETRRLHFTETYRNYVDKLITEEKRKAAEGEKVGEK